jgi:hypothetical protein
VVASSGAERRLYRNDGEMRFTDVGAQQLPAVPSDVKSISYGDIDNDGDLDILLFGAATALLENDGRGWFADRTTARLTAHVREPAARRRWETSTRTVISTSSPPSTG